MWRAGECCEKIGQAIGKSKNAVIGKRSRLALPERGTNRNRPLYDKNGKSIERQFPTARDSEMIIVLRCDYGWPTKSISQALAVKSSVVNKVIQRDTDPA